MAELGGFDPTDTILSLVDQIDDVISANCTAWEHGLKRWDETRRVLVRQAMSDGISPEEVVRGLRQVLGRAFALRALLEPTGEGSLSSVVRSAS